MVNYILKLNKTKGIIVLTLVLILFVCLKYNVLDVPLFWDELGVYGQGIFQMIDTIPSLHPKSLSAEISRGHPLFFSFLYSLFGKITLQNLVSLRLFSLLIAVTTLILMYFNAQLTNFKSEYSIPILMTLLLGSTPLFFAQSSLILPELLLSLLLLLMLLSFVTERTLIFILASSFAILTKESAIILWGSFVLYQMVSPILNTKNYRHRWYLLFIPILPLLIFLQVQYNTHGWYLFPYHANSLEFDLSRIFSKFRKVFGFFFISQGRGFISVVILLFTFINRTKIKWRNSKVLLLLIILFPFLLFHCLSFSMHRYLLPVMPLLFLILQYSLEPLNQIVKWILFAGFIICSVFFVNPTLVKDEFNHADDMSYLQHVVNSQNLINYMNENLMLEEKICVQFPIFYALQDHRYGYLEEALEVDVDTRLDSSTRYIIQQSPPFINTNNFDKYGKELVNQWINQNVTSSLYIIDSK